MQSLEPRVLPPHVETNRELARSSVSLAPLVVSRLSSSGYSSSTASSVAVNCVTSGCPIPTCRMTHTQIELAVISTRTVSVARGGVVSTLRRTVCEDSHKQPSNQLYRCHKHKHSTSCSLDRRSNTYPAPVQRTCESAGLQSCLVLFPPRF